MERLNIFEWLKLVMPLCTPIAITFIGVLINKAIQRQNALAQRQSSWLITWADGFLKTSTSLNEAATNFLLTYWQLANPAYSSGREDNLNLDIVSHYLQLERSQWELHKYTDFATHSGKTLDEAAAELVAEAECWAKNKGGSVPSFRQKQLAFNLCARRVHAELLDLAY